MIRPNCPMDVSKTQGRSDSPRPLRRMLGGLVLGILAATPALAQSAQPDQVLWKNRKGADSKLIGVVTENSLTRVVVEGDRTNTRDAGDVISVRFGDVPPSYADAEGYADRGNHENAAAQYRLAAGDASARDVVRASARLRAGLALKELGAKNPASFGEALAEFERFLGDYPDNREVPTARFYQARMQRLGGDAGTAAEGYRSLYKEASGDTATSGYPLVLCYRAGLAAADAFLAAGDTLQAREIYAEMETLLPRAIAAAPENDPGSERELSALFAQARLGEGRVLLGSGSVSQAKTFFQGLQRSPDADSALLNGARLGLAEALLADGQHRAAQIEFAAVSATEHTDPDRVARALVGMARCALELPGASGRQAAKTWIQALQDHYGDTPAVLEAQEIAKSL